MVDTKYLQRRGLVWYARVRVPPKLRSIVGDTHLRKSLKTKSLAEAQRRRWRAVAEIKAHLDKMSRGEPSKPPPPTPPRPGDPRAWADQIQELRAGGDYQQAETIELLA